MGNKIIPILSENIEEAQRVMQICNACRYCEGFCSVFPAMTKLRAFTKPDLDYLANLCHNCRGCYYACQYAPPHEFNVNVPQTFNKLRADTWQENAWPTFFAKAYQRNGVAVSLITAFSIALIFILSGLLSNSDDFFAARANGDFNEIIPHQIMVMVAGPVFLFSILAMAISGLNYWRSIKGGNTSLKALLEATNDVLTMKNLGGGGDGCNDDNESFSMLRRYLHHAVFYGFMLCFAATLTGTVYHYVFGWKAPHGYLSLPVILGSVGGVLLCGGTAGMYVLKNRVDKVLPIGRLKSMEVAFILQLFFTSLTGLMLLALREGSLMGLMLAVHLGFVLALFICLPYSKMVHGLYRYIALFFYHSDN